MAISKATEKTCSVTVKWVALYNCSRNYSRRNMLTSGRLAQLLQA